MSDESDLRRVFRERPKNFDELVELEKRRIRERGFVQFIDDRGLTQKISVPVDSDLQRRWRKK